MPPRQRQTDGQTDRQMNRQTDRQTDRQVNILGVSISSCEMQRSHAVIAAGCPWVATGNQQHTNTPITPILTGFLQKPLPLGGLQYGFPKLRQKLFQLLWAVGLDSPVGQSEGGGGSLWKGAERRKKFRSLRKIGRASCRERV